MDERLSQGLNHSEIHSLFTEPTLISAWVFVLPPEPFAFNSVLLSVLPLNNIDPLIKFYMKDKKPTDSPADPKKTNAEGYPSHPQGQDIYSKFKEEQDIDPEDISQKKSMDPIEDEDPEELDFADDIILDDDLDVPGAELDDDMEDMGDEDEENNFYSIGGDRHHDLDEDQGEEELDI